MTAPDIDTVATYGGALENAWPIEDPNTDQDADGLNECKASTAAMTHTSARCWARFTSDPTTPAFPSTNPHDSHWGSTLAVRPTLARTGVGVYTLTWPSTVTDELGETHSVNLRWAKASLENQAAVVCAEATSVVLVTIKLFDMAGAAADYAGKVIFVEAG